MLFSLIVSGSISFDKANSTFCVILVVLINSVTTNSSV